MAPSGISAGEGGTLDQPERIIEQIGQGTDTIRITGLAPKDVTLSISPSDFGTLRLALKSPGGSTTYTDFLAHLNSDPANYGQRIERIAFDNGVVWDLTKQTPKFDNYEPRALDDAYSVTAGKTLTVDAAHGVLTNDSDPDGDKLVMSSSNAPFEGKLALASDGAFTFTPNAGFTGKAEFRYFASDGELRDFGDVTITVKPAAAPERQAPPWIAPHEQADIGHASDFDFA
jgi:Big-like domain-containing protein